MSLADNVLTCFRPTYNPVRNEQICSRSFKTLKTLQTNLLSAESVFSLLQTLSLNALRDFKTADEKQTNNRSADYLQRLQMIYNTLKSKNRINRIFIAS